jgi:hypothetical protein
MENNNPIGISGSVVKDVQGETTRSAILGGIPSSHINVPISRSMNFMEIFSAFFAEVFIRSGLLSHDTHTGTMLPHLANVALDEQAGNFFRQLYSHK